MATTTLAPAPRLFFLDGNGRPLVNGQLFTYLAGTTTKLTTYTDSTGVPQNANPIRLDYRGEANVWVPPNVRYKFVLAPATDTDPPTHPIWTVDNIINSQLVTLYGGVDTGTTNAYVLNFAANFSTLTDGIVIFWIPSNNNSGSSTLNVNGLGALPIVNTNGVTLSANQLIANRPAAVIYQGGQWVLFLPQAGVPSSVVKSSTTSRASTTVLTADPHLLFPSGQGTFGVTGLLLFDGPVSGAGGIQLGFYCTGGAGLVSNPRNLVVGTVNGAAFAGKNSWSIAAATAAVSIATISTGGNDALYFSGVLLAPSPGTVGISWAQNSSNVNAIRMLQGSWLQATQLT